MILKFLITGYCILCVAILANIFANLLGVDTWYNLLSKIVDKDFKQILNEARFLNIMWLFFLYPLLLSFGYKVGIALYNFMIQ